MQVIMELNIYCPVITRTIDCPSQAPGFFNE